jgi:ATP-dependent RNA helicase DHX29
MQTNGRATASSMLANAEKKDAGWNANGTNARVLRAVLGSALYANVAKKVRGKQQLELVDANGSMSIHPSSVLASSAQQQKQLATRFVAFHEKFKTKKAYVRECTAITPAMLLMFGGEIQVHHDKAQLTVDRWISIKAKAEHGALFSELRTALDEELGERIRGEERDEQQQESSIVVDAVISLLESERLNN